MTEKFTYYQQASLPEFDPNRRRRKPVERWSGFYNTPLWQEGFGDWMGLVDVLIENLWQPKPEVGMTTPESNRSQLIIEHYDTPQRYLQTIVGESSSLVIVGRPRIMVYYFPALMSNREENASYQLRPYHWWYVGKHTEDPGSFTVSLGRILDNYGYFGDLMTGMKLPRVREMITKFALEQEEYLGNLPVEGMGLQCVLGHIPRSSRVPQLKAARYIEATMNLYHEVGMEANGQTIVDPENAQDNWIILEAILDRSQKASA